MSGGQTAATKKDDGSATPKALRTSKIAKIVPTLVTTLSMSPAISAHDSAQLSGSRFRDRSELRARREP